MTKKEKRSLEWKKNKEEYNMAVINLWREKYGNKCKDKVGR